jgi:hypothetical protein
MDFAGKKEAWVGIFPIARADIGRYDKRSISILRE